MQDIQRPFTRDPVRGQERHAGRGLHIEFLGSPGAGKSSLIPALITVTNRHGLAAVTSRQAVLPFTCRTLPGKLAGAIPDPLGHRLVRRWFLLRSTFHRRDFFQSHPQLQQLVLSTQRARPNEVGVGRNKIIQQFYRLVGNYALLSELAEPGDALIFDEGFVHKVVQLFASDLEEPDPFQVTDYLDLLPQPDLVIFVRAPLDVCEQRIYERGLWGHYQGKTRAQLNRFIANAHRVVHHSVTYLKNKGWTVIEIDNGQPDLQPGIQQVEQAVGRWLSMEQPRGRLDAALKRPAQQA